MKQGYNVINIGMIVAGAILIYSGAKDIPPVELLRQILNGAQTGAKKITLTNTTPGSSFDPDNPDKGAGAAGGGGSGGSW